MAPAYTAVATLVAFSTATAFLAGSLLLTCCWAFTPEPRLLVLATAFVPFALLGYAAAAVLWLLARRRSTGRRRVATTVLAVASTLGAGLHGALLAPSYLGAHASGEPDLTVLTANLRLGLADTADLTRIAERGDADVVVLQEVTPTAYAGLGDLRAELPHTAGTSFAGARGTVVLSRYPLTNVVQLRVFQGSWVMRVAAPTPFWLVAVHTSQPKGVVELWRSDHRSVLWNTTLALMRGPVVAAGDFNATLDHRPMRELLDLGLADASRQANAGWQPTWPNEDHNGLVPLGLPVMAIDHVLVSREFSTISTSTYDIRQSDHRALLARLAVR